MVKRAENGSFVEQMIVEIPRGTSNKYEYDPVQRCFCLDRVLPGANFYPGEYGYIANTLDFDGDPLDAIVLITYPTFPGCRIKMRVLGTIHMLDEGQIDTKLVGVVADDVRFQHLTKMQDINPALIKQITDFFTSYKRLQDKKVEIIKIGDSNDAVAELKSCQRRYQRHQRLLNSGDRTALMRLLAAEQAKR